MTPIVIDVETTGLNPFKDKLLFYTTYDGKTSYVDPKLPKVIDGIGQNLKFDALFLKNNLGIDVNIVWDTKIAEYLLHIDKSTSLKECAKRYFNADGETLIDIYNKVTGQNRKTLPSDFHTVIPRERFIEYGKKDPMYTYKLAELQKEKFLEQPELFSWFLNVEIPLTNIITQSELKGVKVDRERLNEILTDMEIHLVVIDGRLKKLAGKEINYNSPKQLQEWLFNELKLKSKKKTKTGQQATDHKTLEVLATQHAVPKLLLQHRETDKLISTYAKPIIEQLDSNDRLHCTYNQALTVTRRFSSERPNLQNIPNHSQAGLAIQECFVPEKGHQFLIADYDQIELRLLAHFSKDPTLIKAFNENVDVHQITADFISKKLGRDFDRAKGKLLNFSLLYGKTAYGFAQDWNCSKQEAEEIIDAWFALYPQVKDYVQEQQYEITKNNGWTKSLAGLPLYCGDPLTNSRSEYEHYLRCCVNYRIQGSSQDILKQAIVDINRKFDEVPVLMVHDSLIYEVPETLVPEKAHIYCMENVWKLEVPIKVTSKVADRWIK